MAETRENAQKQLSDERIRLEKRKRQVDIVEEMVKTASDEQLEALIELISVFQAMAQQRMAALRRPS